MFASPHSDYVIRNATACEAGLISYLRFASLVCLELPGQSLATIGKLMSALPDIDSQLLAGGTYHVADKGGDLIGGAGWSVLPLVFRGDVLRADNGRPTDIAVGPDAVLVRGFFLDPDMGRRGVAPTLLSKVELGALQAGYSAAEIVVPAAAQLHYRGLGFKPVGRLGLKLNDTDTLPLVHMRKPFTLRLPVAA